MFKLRHLSYVFGLLVFAFFTGFFDSGAMPISKLLGACWDSSCDLTQSGGLPLCPSQYAFCTAQASPPPTPVDTPVPTAPPTPSTPIPGTLTPPPTETPVPTETAIPTATPCSPNTPANCSLCGDDLASDLASAVQDGQTCRENIGPICTDICAGAPSDPTGISDGACLICEAGDDAPCLGVVLAESLAAGIKYDQCRETNSCSACGD
jgi:hypothetical protein